MGQRLSTQAKCYRRAYGTHICHKVQTHIEQDVFATSRITQDSCWKHASATTYASAIRDLTTDVCHIRVSIEFDPVIRDSQITTCVCNNCCRYRRFLYTRICRFISDAFYQHASTVSAYYRRVLTSQNRRPPSATYYRRALGRRICSCTTTNAPYWSCMW